METMGNLILVMYTICMFQLVYNSAGEEDGRCKVDCACCKDRKCGSKYSFFSRECTLGCIDGFRGPRCYIRCTHNCTKCPDHEDTCTECYDNYYPGSTRDCTYKCRDNCVLCSSYDRCSLCKTGFYGPKCDKNCSTGCISNTCDMQTGNCTCFPDFVGVRCDKCKTGKYGNMCNQQCPAGCKSNVCERNSGGCIDGCEIDTIVGDKCDVCSTGWYGQYCNISCSVGCKNQQCEKSNGECSYGCLDNFVGGKCNQCMPDSGESVNTAVVMLGTGFAVSVVVNIILIVTLIFWKCRKRANDNSKKRGPLYGNSGIELHCGNLANAGNVRNHEIVKESNTVLEPTDYQNIGRVQVSEHEYEQICEDTKFL